MGTPWGEVRYVSGIMPTDYTYTGQYSNTDNFGLMFYNARWYDPQLGRFAQADSIIPLQTQGTQAWDRYAYVNNNPVMYTDPSGNYACLDYGFCFPESSPGNTQKIGQKIPVPTPAYYFEPAQPTPNYCEPYPMTTPSPLEDVSNFAKSGNYVLDLLIWVGDYGQPVYKQIKGLGNAGPVIEGLAGAGLQLANDLDDPSLSPIDMGFRAVVIGAEDAVTDIISGGVSNVTGTLGAAAGSKVPIVGTAVGGIAGKVAGNWLTTRFMDEAIWQPFNEWTGLFPKTMFQER